MWLSAAVVFGLGTMTKVFHFMRSIDFFGPKDVKSKLIVGLYRFGFIDFFIYFVRTEGFSNSSNFIFLVDNQLDTIL